MNKKYGLAFLIVVFLITAAGAVTTPYTEDLMKIGVGARPMGMGKAFVAAADDGNSPFLNPAGLASLTAWQFTSMYVNLLDGDLPYTLISGSLPLKKGNLGLGIISCGTYGIQSPGPQSISSFDYYDRLIFLTYGAQAGSIISLGANLKYFSKGFTGSGGNTSSGANLDLGLKLKYNEGLTLGADLQNVLPTRLVWTSGAEDDIPMLIKLGMSSKLMKDRGIADLDVDIPTESGQSALMHAGVEWGLSRFFIVRGGFDQILSADQTISTNLTAGLGLNLNGMRFDYAYHFYTDLSSGVSHFFSFSFSPSVKTPARN